MSTEKRRPDRRPLITHNHQKRSLTTGIVSLAVIILIIVMLPRVVDLLSG